LHTEPICEGVLVDRGSDWLLNGVEKTEAIQWYETAPRPER